MDGDSQKLTWTGTPRSPITRFPARPTSTKVNRQDKTTGWSWSVKSHTHSTALRLLGTSLELSCAWGFFFFFLHGNTRFIVEIETIKVKGIVQARYMPSQGRLCALMILTTIITSSSRWHTIVVQGPVGELQGASAFQSDAVFRPVT